MNITISPIATKQAWLLLNKALGVSIFCNSEESRTDNVLGIVEIDSVTCGLIIN